MAKITERRNTIWTDRTSNEDIDEIKELHSQDMVENFSSNPKEYFVQKMGSYLHEERRKTRLKED